MHLPNAPYRILALAPFTMSAGRTWGEKPISVDRYTLDEAMRAMAISDVIPLDRDLCPAGGIELHCKSFKSLHPDGIIKSNTYLSHLLAAREHIIQSRRSGMQSHRILSDISRKWPDLPDINLADHGPAKPDASKSSDALDNLLDMVALPGQGQSLKPNSQQDETGQVDERLGKILDAVFQWPPFRQMESAWRGLRLLLQQGISDAAVAVEIVPVHPDSLAATLEAITPLVIDQPPGVIVLDMAFDNSALAMERLAGVAQWAATLMVPVVAWSPSRFLEIEKWADIASLAFLPTLVSQSQYAKYAKLRQSADGHWISLACNRLLTRYPYGKDNTPRTVTFSETSPPWIAPVWAISTLIAQSVSQTGWPTRLGHRQRFNIQDLALNNSIDRPSTGLEASFGADRRDQLIRAGLTPLAGERDIAFVTRAVMLSGMSLAYQLLVCRVSQFLLWCKDNLPTETEPSALETQLRLAFQVLGEQSRPQAFESIVISTGEPGNDGRIPVKIKLVPGSTVLESRHSIEMELAW